ncbi:MAG: type II secretion system protein GspJ [Spirochaetota bacterium]
MKRNPAIRKGTNLVELAIVVMILGTMFVGIFACYYTALKISKNSAPKIGSSKKDVLYAVENVRKTLTQTFYNTNAKQLVFKGKGSGVGGERSDRLVLAAHHSGSEDIGSPAIREVEFFLREMTEEIEIPGAGKYYTLVRREDEMVDNLPLRGGTEHVLLEYVKSFQLKYSTRGIKWLDEWDAKLTKSVPKLIRIEIIALIGKKEVKYETLAFPGLYFK